MPIFARVKDCAFGGTAIPLVRRVELSEMAAPVLDGPDDAAWATLAAAGRRHVEAAVHTDAAGQALADLALGDAGTLEFTAEGPGSGERELAVSVAGAVLVEKSPALPGPGRAAAVVLRFAAASADGQASPVTTA